MVAAPGITKEKKNTQIKTSFFLRLLPPPSPLYIFLSPSSFMSFPLYFTQSPFRHYGLYCKVKIGIYIPRLPPSPPKKIIMATNCQHFPFDSVEFLKFEIFSETQSEVEEEKIQPS